MSALDMFLNNPKSGLALFLCLALSLRVSAGASLPGYLSNISSLNGKVYYAPERKLYNVSDVGSQGPCKRNMMLVRMRDSQDEVTCICQTSRRLFMLPFNTGCFEIYTQGPCLPNHWVQMIGGKGECVRNPCSNQGKKSSSPEVLVDYNGSCVPVNSPCDDGGFRVQVSKRDEGYRAVCNPPVEDCIDIAPEFISAPNCPDGEAVANDGLCYVIAQVPLDPIKRGKSWKRLRIAQRLVKPSRRSDNSSNVI